MTDETNYPPKAKVNLPNEVKRKQKDWRRRKRKTEDEDPPRESGR